MVREPVKEKLFCPLFCEFRSFQLVRISKTPADGADYERRELVLRPRMIKLSRSNPFATKGRAAKARLRVERQERNRGTRRKSTCFALSVHVDYEARPRSYEVGSIRSAKELRRCLQMEAASLPR